MILPSRKPGSWKQERALESRCARAAGVTDPHSPAAPSQQARHAPPSTSAFGLLAQGNGRGASPEVPHAPDIRCFGALGALTERAAAQQ